MILLRVFLEELRSIFMNKGTLLVLVAGAFIYGFFYPLPYQPQVAHDLPVVAVDGDHSAMSRKLLQFADASPQVAIARVVSTREQAARIMEKGQALGVFVIPPDFERNILRGEHTFVGIYGDASYFLVYSSLATGLASATGTLSAGIEIRRLQASGSTRASAMAQRDPLPAHIIPLYNETGGYGDYVVPAVLILILQQTLLIGVGMLAGSRREEDIHTLFSRQQEPSFPRRAWHNMRVLIGRSLAYVAIYCGHIAVYLFVIYRIFDFPQRGDIGTIYLFLLPFLLATTFMATTLATLFRERETGMQILLFSSMPAIFISGFSWPIEGMPVWVQKFAMILPSTSAIDGYMRLNHLGTQFYHVLGDWWTLWILAAVYFVCTLLAAAFVPRRPTQTEFTLSKKHAISAQLTR